MHSSKRSRTKSDGPGEEEGEPAAVAAGFEAPIFGARTVGQVTTLALEGEDGLLASLDLRGVKSVHAGAWYVATKDSLLHVSAARRVRTVATCKGGHFFGIATSLDVSALFVSDIGNHKIRRVEVATGAVTTIAGSGASGSADGVGDAAQFSAPRGLAISPDGSALFVADFFSHKIRRVEWRRALSLRSRVAAPWVALMAWAARRSSATRTASQSARTAAHCLWRMPTTTRSVGRR